MKFTIISHACMLVEGDHGSILVDPWFVGTCFWRSWWNFPEPTQELVADLKPDYIYITHLHWDHFHGPTLRRFDRDIRILVPKCPTRRMVRDLHRMKYKNVGEISHGASVELWKGFHLHSFQFGPFFTDSAIVFSDGKTNIANLNDCKLFGLPLQQLSSRFKKIDFCMRSHSSASPLPYCVKDYKEQFPELRSQQAYIDEFTNCCLSVGARYAIPFASNHCFLHRETVAYNDTSVNPAMVEQNYNRVAKELGLESTCVVMAPGSSWSDREGFSIERFDYANKQQYLGTLQKKYHRKLSEQYEKEDRAKASYVSFEKYFTKMIAATPGYIRKKWLPVVQFKVQEKDAVKYWIVDFPNKEVRQAESSQSAVADFTIEVHALVLNDCTRKLMFSSWAGAKRLRIILHSDNNDLLKVGTLLSFLDYYENDGLPLRNNFSPRQLGVRLRRWRKLAETVRMFVRHKILRRPMVVKDLYPVKPAPGYPKIQSDAEVTAPLTIRMNPEADLNDDSHRETRRAA